MEKYEVYVSSGYFFKPTQADALKRAKALLDFGLNVEIKAKEVSEESE